MVCAPSVAVSQGYPQRTSEFAAEGTVAHEMASTCLETGLDAHEVWQAVPVASQDGHDVPITVEMRAYVQSYLDYVRALEGGMVVEKKIEFKADPDFGGTADVQVWDLANRTLHVVDFKYGKGVKVSAENNPQGMSYALLSLAEASDMVDIDQVVIHIHQPRMDNIDVWSTHVGAIVAFASEVSTAIARARSVMRAIEKGISLDNLEYVPGEHCGFCPHAAKCKGLRDHSIVSAQHVFGPVSEVPTQTLGEILAKADMIDAWIAAVRKEAMDRALKGEPITGYKLVQKRASRAWTDTAKVEEIALDNLLDVHEKVLVSPPQVEKRFGKAALALFEGLVQSVSSGLTLVAADDKRSAVDPATASAEKAQAVFTAVE
jgi:hypothetical protein